jgi:hypothetical protein
MKQYSFSIVVFFLMITFFLTDVEAVDKKYIKFREIQSRKKESPSPYLIKSVVGVLKYQGEQLEKVARTLQEIRDAQYSYNTQCASIRKTQQEQASDLAAQWREVEGCKERLELLERSNSLISFIENNLINRLIAKGVISPDATLDRMRSSSVSSSEKSGDTSPSATILEASSSSDEEALRGVRALGASASPRERVGGAQLHTSPFSEEGRALKERQNLVKQLLHASSPTAMLRRKSF